MYWTDWRFQSVLQANKFNGSDIRVLDQSLSQPCDLVIIHPSRQPKILNSSDPRLSCPKLRCTHLCLLSKDGPKCACPHLWKLDKDQKSCIPHNKFILFSRSNEIRGLDMDEGQISVIPALALAKDQKPVALDVIHGGTFGESTAVMNKLYWIEHEELKLQRSNWNSTNVETLLNGLIVSTGLITEDHDIYEAFSVDWTTGNIYFATSVSIMIEDMSESTSNVIVYNQHMEYFQTVLEKSPRLIRGLVLAPALGMMYWHDHDIDIEALNMAKMDGSEPEQFHVFHHHPHIRGMTYCKDRHALFWISNNYDVQMWDFKSKNPQNIYESNDPMRSLDVSSNRIFFR